MTAFEHGWTDAERGCYLYDNPYQINSGAWIAWRAGYRARYGTV